MHVYHKPFTPNFHIKIVVGVGTMLNTCPEQWELSKYKNIAPMDYLKLLPMKFISVSSVQEFCPAFCFTRTHFPWVSHFVKYLEPYIWFPVIHISNHKWHKSYTVKSRSLISTSWDFFPLPSSCRKTFVKCDIPCPCSIKTKAFQHWLMKPLTVHLLFLLVLFFWK